MKQVLIGIPTFSGEQYCREAFFTFLSNLTYENLSFVIVTNSGEADKKDLEQYLKQLPGGATVLVAPEKKNVIDQITTNRNIIREHLLASDAEYLFFMDSDLLAPTNCIQALMQHNEKFVSGWYLASFNYNDKKQILPVVYDFDTKSSVRQMKISEMLDPKLKQIASVGFGCALLHRSLLDEPFIFGKGTEDSLFCMRMHKQKQDIWLDTRVACWHMKFPPGDKRNNLLDPRNYKKKKHKLI